MKNNFFMAGNSASKWSMSVCIWESAAGGSFHRAKDTEILNQARNGTFLPHVVCFCVQKDTEMDAPPWYSLQLRRSFPNSLCCLLLLFEAALFAITSATFYIPGFLWCSWDHHLLQRHVCKAHITHYTLHIPHTHHTRRASHHTNSHHVTSHHTTPHFNISHSSHIT